MTIDVWSKRQCISIVTIPIVRSPGLPVDLPSAQTAEPEQSVQLNITIEHGAVVKVMDRLRQVPEARMALAADKK